MKNEQGQALLESVFIIPLIAVIIVAIGWFGHVLLVRQQLVAAARYGTDLIVFTSLNEEAVRREVTEYLCGTRSGGKRLDPRKLGENRIEVKIRRDKGELNPLYGFREIDDRASFVRIAYPVDVPPLFRSFGDDLPFLRLSARSEILAGTGCGNRH